jgi:hypothetical protein
MKRDETSTWVQKKSEMFEQDTHMSERKIIDWPVELIGEGGALRGEGGREGKTLG